MSKDPFGVVFAKAKTGVRTYLVIDRQRWIQIFELLGSALAIVYALLIALNIGQEMLGFALLLVSALLFAGWGIVDRRWAFFTLQLFYITSAIIGLLRHQPV